MRGERTKKKLEKAFSFMVRVRLPGGLVTPRNGWRWTASPMTTPTARCG